ncbi:MAG: NAD(P)/FAD-dependent oxidoreductase, partial [Desulfobacterales bacterium]|nr:NAD(P)/FAD-dependent oxidoreductase [Desulfobacterales bacterium]
AQLGGKVVLVEEADIGGMCVNRGCIPAKVWGQGAYLKRVIKNAEAFGISATVKSTDLSVLVARTNGSSGDIKMGMGGLLKNNRIEVIQGKGFIKGPGKVEVNGKQLEAKNIIIATGTSPVLPDIKGIDGAHLSTDQLFGLDQLPESVMVYGAGHVEVEMASILNAFGCKMILAFEDARILPFEDGDTSQRIAGILREQGMEILPRVSLKSVKKSGKSFQSELAGKEEKSVTVNRILTSIRQPNTQEIGLEAAGISIDDKGFITVDEHLKTNVDTIYAIGDVTGGWQLSYAATVMGVVAAENAMGQASVFNNRLVPRGVNTFPEAAAIGLSEEEAEQMAYEVEVGNFPMSINGVAIARGELDGAVKIVSEAKYGEVLGVHIVGSHANELIWGAGLAMQMEATVEDIARTIVVHPTFSESIPLASQDAMNWSLYLPKK